MDSIKGTISSVTGADSTRIDDNSIKRDEPTASAMDSIRGAINSVTGAGSTQTDADSNKNLMPTPPETGLQSRGQTTQSGSGSFLSEMKDMVNSAIGGGGTKEEKGVALDKGITKPSAKWSQQLLTRWGFQRPAKQRHCSWAGQGRANRGVHQVSYKSVLC